MGITPFASTGPYVNKPDLSSSAFSASLDATPTPTWTPAFREVWPHDVRASVVVFLVALPLCLGIALASGAPLISGLVTGVIGGIVVGTVSGSHLLVSGPAAGLTAVALSAISSLGGFPAFLTALFLAGLMQIALGLLRAGLIGYYFSNSVIRGMLTGIGLIIILKQLPYVFGADAHNATEGIAAAFAARHGGAVLISIVALAILVSWDLPFMKRAAVVPGALVAVVVCTVLNELLGGMSVAGAQLVVLPPLESLGELGAALDSPRWSVIGSEAVWLTALTIAIVASMETLLSLEATDRIDPLKREAPANRELLAQGFGNTLCGLLGGLPMTGVIIRSSANVYAGARTKASAILHGVLLLVAVLSIPSLLNRIPLAVLAVVLIHNGWKLAHPRQLRYFMRQSFHQWLPFVATIAGILLEDLLVGIAIGLSLSLFFILMEHLLIPCFDREVTTEGITYLRLNKHLTFLHKASLTAALQKFPPGSHVVLDGSMCRRVDHDVVEVLREFQASTAERKLEVKVLGIDLGSSTLELGH